MKAALCTAYGGPDVLRVGDLPTPVPGSGEVLLRIEAASVASGDLRVRGLDVPPALRPMLRAVFGWRRPRQPVLGTECAGVVAAVGPGVTRFREGDAVVAFPGTAQGCHAEFRVMREDGRVLHRPPGLSDAEAGALFFGATTALHFLERLGGMQAGQRVLVIGAAGVVGHAGVQIARALGAEVGAVVRAAHLDLARALGATAFARDADDPGGGWDLVLDTAGGTPPATLRRHLAPGGRMLLVNAGPGQMLAALIHRDRRAGPAPERLEDMARICDWVDEGTFRPLIDRTFALDDIAAAHVRRAEPGRAGAVVILP
jgi:NADPH:quinone reductase-like Zn-dependent oxidoreductase